MAGFKVQVDQNWRKMIEGKQQEVATAAVAALRDVAAGAVQEGRQNIAAGGRFAGSWVSGLQYRTQRGEASAVIFHKFGIAGVFEHGATIQGKPLLWIPTTPKGPPASRSGKKLVSATVRGQPMMFDEND